MTTTNNTFIGARGAFYIAAGVLLAMFLLYVGLVNRTIMNVVARERMQKEIATISTSMGDLEFSYITLKNNVTLELAHEKGFTETAPRTFLAREKSLPSLSYNNPR